MRKIIVLLLVGGLLVGTCAMISELEEQSFQEYRSFQAAKDRRGTWRSELTLYVPSTRAVVRITQQGDRSHSPGIFFL